MPDDFAHLQEILFVHPDGKPHAKACGGCAFRRSNPQNLSEADFDWMYLQRESGGFTFYCAHREDGGWHRECASWAAIERGREAEHPPVEDTGVHTCPPNTALRAKTL